MIMIIIIISQLRTDSTDTATDTAAQWSFGSYFKI